MAAVAMSIAAAFALAGPVRAAQPKSHSQMVHDVVDQYVVPHVEMLDASALRLADHVTSLCQTNSTAASLSTARASFAGVVTAWAGVEFLRFGPMGEDGRVERFAFWPDTRGIVFRQLPPLLAKRDAALLEPGVFAKQSAAVQGLHALELILFDDQNPLTVPDGAYRCSFAAAIAGNLKQIAHDLVTAWEDKTGWRHRMFVPGSDNPVYPEPADAARDLVRSLLTGLQLVQERQVQPRRDTMIGVGKTPRLPFERSGLGVAYLIAGVTALEAFDDALAISAYAPADKSWMKGWSKRAFELMVRDAPAVPLKTSPPADPAKIDNHNPQLRTLRQMRFHLNGLRHVIGRELAPAAGLSIGFNELDGD